MFSQVFVCPWGWVSLVPCFFQGVGIWYQVPSRGWYGYGGMSGVGGVPVWTWDTIGHGWQADGTYPTRMRSCF